MKCSIVIPSYNGKHLLEKNLPKVIKAAKGSEVIVVDDGSKDGSATFIKRRFPNTRVIEHKKNLRYAESCNSGVRAAREDIVVLLNNDVSPKEDFLNYLIPHFKDKRIFAVGCLEKSENKSRGKSIGKFQKGLVVHQEAKDRKPGITFWAFGASAAFNRKKWLELGGMDHLFHPAYWEDIDLSYRGWKRGWEVRFEPRSVVIHEPETSNIQAFSLRGIRRISAKNQLLFVWKNIHNRQMIFSHLLWMPIHLVTAVISGDVKFVLGFFDALTQLPEALSKRSKAKKKVLVSDRRIMNMFIR